MGTISLAQYVKSDTEIQINRIASAESLTLSASQANLASDNLKSAATRGQTGLEWHFARQETLQSKQSQRGLRFHFCDFAAKKNFLNRVPTFKWAACFNLKR
jgi:hypothetical protein